LLTTNLIEMSTAVQQLSPEPEVGEDLDQGLDFDTGEPAPMSVIETSGGRWMVLDNDGDHTDVGEDNADELDPQFPPTAMWIRSRISIPSSLRRCASLRDT
jgi:hypothetical protein